MSWSFIGAVRCGWSVACRSRRSAICGCSTRPAWRPRVRRSKRTRPQGWELTGICDRIAIATNGTAVLGLGDIGVLPSLPVMEGKAAILAEFVDVSGVPILIETKDVDTFVEAVVRIAASFGAIQLEDVAAPACFEIEEKLRDRLDIPVFHDDQHGTATVVLAAVINALKQTGRKAQDCSAIVVGAGAAGTAVTKNLLGFGIGDVVVYDSVGPIYRGRTAGMNPYKEQLAQVTNRRGFTGTSHAYARVSMAPETSQTASRIRKTAAPVRTIRIQRLLVRVARRRFLIFFLKDRAAPGRQLAQLRDLGFRDRPIRLGRLDALVQEVQVGGRNGGHDARLGQRKANRQIDLVIRLRGPVPPVPRALRSGGPGAGVDRLHGQHGHPFLLSRLDHRLAEFPVDR